ncbi:MAG: hypothetical protein HC900_10450 [Methylacidiphilales bacterium]|nr:hypothetical protein [Candidatus Methylacidiphilales bacterium]
MTESVEQSKALRNVEGFHVIIAASGMCEAGRIRHHLKHWLASPTATVLLVGFQAAGTLGRFLQEGADTVRIQGDDVEVYAAIRVLDAYSGHADGPELVDWLRRRGRPSTALFLVHGEESALASLKEQATKAGLVDTGDVIVPGIDEVFSVTRGEVRLTGRAPSASRARTCRGSTGTMTSHVSSSTSTLRCARPPTRRIGRSCSGGCAVPWRSSRRPWANRQACKWPMPQVRGCA